MESSHVGKDTILRSPACSGKEAEENRIPTQPTGQLKIQTEYPTTKHLTILQRANQAGSKFVDTKGKQQEPEQALL